MIWIDPEVETNRSQETLLKASVVLDSFDDNSNDGDCVFFTKDALDKLSNRHMFVQCRNGKGYKGDYTRCKETKQKSMITGFTIGKIDGKELYQLIATLDNEEQIDARGYYSRHSLKVIPRNKKLKSKREK